MNKLVKLLKENIGKEFRYTSSFGDVKEGIITEVHLNDRMLTLNKDMEIDLNKYKKIVLLKDNFICFRGRRRSSLLLIK